MVVGSGTTTTGITVEELIAVVVVVGSCGLGGVHPGGGTAGHADTTAAAAAKRTAWNFMIV